MVLNKLLHNTFSFFILVSLLFVFNSCSKSNDQKVENCFDGIQNQGETGIDCGGPCFFTCPMAMTAKVNGNSWVADTSKIQASYNSTSKQLTLTGSIAATLYPRIQLISYGTLQAGSRTLDNASSYTPDISAFVDFNSGTISLTEVDTRNKIIKGTFNFSCTDTASGTNYVITDGTFVNVSY